MALVNSVIQSDVDIKQRFSQLCKDMGMSFNEVINAMMTEAVNTGTINISSKKTKWLDKLDELSSMPYNWDGYQAYPISKVVVDFTRDLISKLNDKVLEKWWLVPVANGTLEILPCSKVKAFISLGTDGFSYGAKAPEKATISGKEPLTIKNATEIINEITSNYLS